MRSTASVAALAALVTTLFGAPPRALGHAVVVRASLDQTAIPAETPRDVVLEFNSGIETKLSKVVLVAEGGDERPLELGAAGAQNELHVKVPALAAGHYGLRYKVLAADGHVTESVLRFTVEPEKPAKPAQPAQKE